MIKQLNNGIRLRWLNTAGFEMILPSGAHLLVDPWLDNSDVYPISIDEIERADYILLSHIHFDHAQDIGALMAKFPKAKLFVGDLAVVPLCKWQRVSLTNIYRVRNGDQYTFEDVDIKVFGGRHTEAAKGAYYPEKFAEDCTNLDHESGYYGSFDMENFLITAADGTKVLIWGGMTSAEQKYRLSGLKPDIACMHLSPKQIPAEFADMVNAIGPKVVFPHHYDMAGPLFDARPELIDYMLPAWATEAYLVDGKFNTTAFVDTFNKAIKELAPTTDMMELEHHKWYKLGFWMEAE